ncbi:MAG: tetratricopeptide repeat protein, partial [Armatimonadetes bacterium]|nr:tetratricopeptide repeat protein [Armatimonadota bacterium]
MARGQWEQAVELLSEILAANPDRHDVRLNLGVALYNLGRFSEALEQFERLVAACPEMAEAWANLGAAANELGHLARAEEALLKAADLNQRLRDLHLNIALLRLKQRRLAEAIAELE